MDFGRHTGSGNEVSQERIIKFPFSKGTLEDHMKALDNLFYEYDTTEDITNEKRTSTNVFVLPYANRLKEFLTKWDGSSTINGF